MLNLTFRFLKNDETITYLLDAIKHNDLTSKNIKRHASI